MSSMKPKDRSGRVEQPSRRKAAGRRFGPAISALEPRQMLTTGLAALSQHQMFEAGVAGGPVLIATFTDSDPATMGYTAAINWGDGTSSAGTVAADPNVPGRYDVTAAHTFAKPGINLVSATITNTGAETSRTVSSLDGVVVPAPVVSASAPSNLSVGAAVTHVQVATFTEADVNLAAGDFSASVDWGDGTTSGGTVAADPTTPGRFVVTASKPSGYAHVGSPTLGVNVGIPGNAPSDNWNQLAGMPEALGFVAPSFSGGLVYQVGGVNGSGHATQHVNAYDPATNSWSSRADLPGQDSVLASTVGPDGKLYVAAYDPVDAYNRMDIYSPATDTWSSTGSVALPSGGFSMTTGPDGLIYIVGGQAGGTALSSVSTYDPSTQSLGSVASLPTARMNISTVTGADGNIYAIGGDTGTSTVSEVDRYDPATGVWTQVAKLSVSGAQMVAGVQPDGQIFIAGGYNSSSGWVMTASTYNPGTNSWSPAASLLSWRLYEGGTIGPDGRIYLMGNAGPGNELDAYNPAATAGVGSVPLSIAKGTPTITWANPADILAGTALGPAQLDASTPVAGTFTFTPAAGTVLTAGLHQALSATFTPADAADYNPVTVGASIDVLAPPTIVAGATTVVGQALSGVAVATFTAPTFPNATAADFSATVAWGDGSTSPGVITADPDVPGQFLVSISRASLATVAGSQSFQVTVSAIGQQQPASWSTVADLGGSRGELAAAASGGKVYVIGGYQSGYLSTVQAYDPQARTLTAVSPLPVAIEDIAAATGPDGTIYVLGGDNSSASYLNSVYAYHPGTDTWTQVANLPAGREYIAAATGPDGRIYAIGGYGSSGNQTSEVDAYDPKTDTWTVVAPLPVAVGGAAATTGPDGRIYLIGGSLAGGGYSSATYAYDTAANTWTRVADLPAPIGFLAATTASDGTIYAIGGDSTSSYYLSTVYAYDAATDTWSRAADLMQGSEENAAAAGPDGEVYLIGGYSSGSGHSLIQELPGPVVPTGNVSGTMTLAPGAAASFSITGASGGVGGAAQTFTVTAYDAYGNVATGYSGMVHFSSTDPLATLPVDSTLVSGVGTFSVTLMTAGVQSVSAGDSADPSVAGSVPGIDVTAMIRGRVFLNPSVASSPGAQSVGLGGRVVYLDLGGVGHFVAGDPTTTTAPDGSFSFPGYAQGAYAALEDLGQAGAIRHAVDMVSTAPDGSVTIGVVPTSTVVPTTPASDPFAAFASSTYDGAYVESLYRAVLGRQAEAWEVAGWTARIDAGMSLATVAAAFVASPEHRAAEVASFYQTFLHRAPDVFSRAWVDALVSGATEQQVVDAILDSAEYRAGKDAQAFVTGLYLDVLGRQAGDPEVAGWVAALAGGMSMDQVAAGFVGSPEAVDQAVEGLYSSYLRRGSDAVGRNSWTGLLGGSRPSPSGVVGNFLASQEYQDLVRQARGG